MIPSSPKLGMQNNWIFLAPKIGGAKISAKSGENYQRVFPKMGEKSAGIEAVAVHLLHVR